MIALLTFGACNQDDSPPTPQEEQLAILIDEVWGDQNGSSSNQAAPPGTVIVDGQDVSVNFIGFSLSFTDGGYTTTGAEDLFKASGTWEWMDEEARMLSLDDGKEVTILELSETVFSFRFTFTSNGGAANLVNGISGTYVIRLVR